MRTLFMHILISAVSGSHSPSGICRHAANLAVGLSHSREIDRVTLLVGSWQADYFRNSFALRDPKLHLVSVNIRPSTLSRNFWYLFGLPNLITRCSPDVVHLSYPAPLLKNRIAPVVVSTIHDLYPYDLPANFGHLRAVFNRWLLRICIRESDHLTCVSNATQNRLLRLFPSLSPTKVSQIYNIVGNAFSPERTSSATPLTTRPFVLSVAQHRRNKRLDLLLLAFSQLLSTGELHSSTLLMMIGNSGPETARLQQLIARLHLESNVQMAHGLSDSDLAWLYNNCLFLPCLSTCEGFNLPVAEAFNAGARVICSDIPVHREIAGDACEYFDPSSPDALHEFSNAVRRSLRERVPCSRRSNMFSSDVVIPQYISLYLRSLAIAASHLEGMKAQKTSHELRAS